METAESVLDTISLDDIIDLGNAWIRLGDELHERRVAVGGHLGGLGMTGEAGDQAHRAWDEALGKTIDDAAETAWTIGQTIHRYAEELHKAADEYAKKVNASMWASLLGAIVGLAFLFVGPLLSSLLSMIGALLSRLIPVLAQMAARLTPIGRAIAEGLGGAVAGAATNLGIDVAVGEAGAAIAGTDYDIDWGAEALSMGLGGILGGGFGAYAGFRYKPNPAKPGPVADTTVPKVTISAEAEPGRLSGNNGPLGAAPGQKFVVNPLKGPEGGLGGFEGYNGRLDGKPLEQPTAPWKPWTPWTSGRSSASGKSGAEGASGGRGLEGYNGRLDGKPIEKPAAWTSWKPWKSGADGGSGSAAWSPRAKSMPTTSKQSEPQGSTPSRPRPLGERPKDSFGHLQPRPAHVNRPGEPTAASAKPPASGVGQERQAPLGGSGGSVREPGEGVGNVRPDQGGRASVGAGPEGSRSGSGEGGGVRADEGNNGSAVTQPPGSHPGVSERTGTAGDEGPTPSSGAAASGSAAPEGAAGRSGAAHAAPTQSGRSGGGASADQSHATGNGTGAARPTSTDMPDSGARAGQGTADSKSGPGSAKAGWQGESPAGTDPKLVGGRQLNRSPDDPNGTQKNVSFANPAAGNKDSFAVGGRTTGDKPGDKFPTNLPKPGRSEGASSGHPVPTKSSRGYGRPATLGDRPSDATGGGSGGTTSSGPRPSPFAYGGRSLNEGQSVGGAGGRGDGEDGGGVQAGEVSSSSSGTAGGSLPVPKSGPGSAKAGWQGESPAGTDPKLVGGRQLNRSPDDPNGTQKNVSFANPAAGNKDSFAVGGRTTGDKPGDKFPTNLPKPGQSEGASSGHPVPTKSSRGYGRPATLGDRPSDATGGGSGGTTSSGPRPSPFAYGGRTLDEPMGDLFGHKQPRPDGAMRFGTETPGVVKPPKPSGIGYDRPATLGDIPDGAGGGGGRGAGEGGGNLRANEGSNTYVETQPTGARPGPSEGDGKGNVPVDGGEGASVETQPPGSRPGPEGVVAGPPTAEHDGPSASSGGGRPVGNREQNTGQSTTTTTTTEPGPTGPTFPETRTPERSAPAVTEGPVGGGASGIRHPGAARFDIDTARARLDDPSVPQERRDTSRQWAEQAVTRRIAQVAPGERPEGVLPRMGEVIDLVAAEYLRGGHLPATALLHSLTGQPQAAPPAHATARTTPAAQATPTTPTPAPAVLPAPPADLAARLPGMTPEERTRELTLLPSGQLDALAADPALIADLRRQLPPADFADTAAQLLVRVPDGVEQPISARREAQALVTGMLADSEVTERLLAGGTRLFVVPRDTPLTALGPFADLYGARADGRPYSTVRGIHHNGQVAVPEENLLGEATAVPGDGVYADGYSTLTHEFAHAIHEGGLSPADRALIESAYQTKVAEGDAAHWPDGPLRDPSGVRPGTNYSSHDAHEYFAQLSNAYLGANEGTDWYTGAVRNNGPDWVRQHEPELLPLLERLYGPRNNGDVPVVNPVTAVQAENEVWAYFRAMWDDTEQQLHPQPHAQAPRPTAPLDVALETHSAPVAAAVPSGHPRLAPPTSTTTMLEEPATQPPAEAAPVSATARPRPDTTTPKQPVTETKASAAPPTEAPPTQAPATEAARTQAPAIEAPAAQAPPTHATPVRPADLARLRYQHEAEAYERRLGDYLSEHPQVIEQMAAFARVLWERTPPAMRGRLGTPQNVVPGAVGTDPQALEQVARHGNFREQSTLVWNALRYGVFGTLLGTSLSHPPVIAQERRWRGAPSDGPFNRRAPHELRPPLSSAERAFSSDGATWKPGEEQSGIDHRPPMPTAGDTRPLTLEDSPHATAQRSGGLILTGTSGTVYNLLEAAEAANEQWDAGLDLRWMRMAAVGTLLSNRHHTLHELLAAAELWGNEAAHPDRRGLGFDYDDNWGRYHRLPPLSEQELREHVAVGGRFPDERVQEFYADARTGVTPGSTAPPLSRLLPESSWWRLFIDPNVHDEAFRRSAEDVGGHLDATTYPGYRQGMTAAYREVLDGGRIGRDWSRIDADAYEELHNMATRYLVPGTGQNTATTWSGHEDGRTTMRGTGVDRVAPDIHDDLLLGRRLLFAVGERRQPGTPNPLVVFHHGQQGGQVSIDYSPREARLVVQAALDRYYGEVAVAAGPDDKLRAIARVTRALQVLQPFTDANSRVNVHLLMQKFLLEQGFRPAVLMNSRSLFLGGFTVEQIVESLKEGMERFDRHVRWASWDGFNQPQGPPAEQVDQLAADLGLTGGTPEERRRQVTDTVRTARALFGSELPGTDEQDTARLAAIRSLSGPAGARFPHGTASLAITEYTREVFGIDSMDEVSHAHIGALVDAALQASADGRPLDIDVLRSLAQRPPVDESGPDAAAGRSGSVSPSAEPAWDVLAYEPPSDGITPLVFLVSELTGNVPVRDADELGAALLPAMNTEPQGSVRIVLQAAARSFSSDPVETVSELADSLGAPVDLLLAGPDGAVRLLRFDVRGDHKDLGLVPEAHGPNGEAEQGGSRLDAGDLSILLAEVIREMRRLKGLGRNDPVDVDEQTVRRLHGELTSDQLRRPIRARGEVIAQIMVSGKSGGLLGGAPTATTTELEEPATHMPPTTGTSAPAAAEAGRAWRGPGRTVGGGSVTEQPPAATAAQPAAAEPVPPAATTAPADPATHAPAAHTTPTPATSVTQTSAAAPPASVEDQLAERGLLPVPVLAGGDALAHSLIAVASKESGQMVGQGRPATPAELRAEIADAVAADLRRAPAARTLLSTETVPDGPDGASRLPGTSHEGSAEAVVRGLRAGNGPESLDWLTIGVAARGLELRITVLTPGRAPWTTGPDDGRSVVLVRQERSGPHTGRWAATEPVAAAEQPRRPGPERAGETPGFAWGDTTSGTARPAATSAKASGPAQPAVFFGADPRPTRQTTDESAPAAHDPGEGSSRGPAAGGSGAGAGTGSGSGAGSGSGSGGPGSGQAPVAQSGDGDGEVSTPAPRTLSRYARAYGSRHDGLIGLVPHEPLPDDVLAALHQQVLTALGVPSGSDAEAAALQQLREELSAAEIGLHLPYVRSTRGYRVTVTVDGTQHTVDVRLRLTDPQPAARGTQGGLPRDTRLERQSEGTQTSSTADSSGTMRTIPIPWSALYNGPAGPLRWFDGALTLNLTHNQLAQSATVSEGVMTTSMQRANDQAHVLEFTGQWQVRVDAGGSAPTDGWGAEQSHGSLTVWFPEYRAFGHGGALGPFPEPAGLDDLQLWGVDAVAEPGRLLDDLLADNAFAALRNLSEGSHGELREFLSEEMLRNTLSMQRDRGVYSPLLVDGSGNAVGVLRLVAAVRPGSASAQTPNGDFRLESWITHTTGVDRSARLTSGVGLDGSGGPSFTSDHAKGHPNAARRTGGGVFGKAGLSWQSSDALNTSNKASMMHALYTDASHLHVPADVTYEITLVRAGGGRITGSYGPWPESVQLRVLPRGTGHAPTRQELRALPGHLEHLESVGFSAVPLAVHGVDRMFHRAEEWLRREGFLPPVEHHGLEWNEARTRAQLANVRRLEQLRSRLGLAAALPDAVEGGRSVWFERPGLMGGIRRVQLRFTAARDRIPRPGEAGTPAATHIWRLPEVQTAGNTSFEARGTRQRANQFGGTLGFGGGPRWALAGGAAALDTTGEYVWGKQHSASASAGSSQGGDQTTITSSGGTEVFTVPARFALNLYEGSAEDPLVRFADPASDPASEHPRPAPVGPLGLRGPAPQAPETIAGHITLAVPHQRTVPVEGRIVPAPARNEIRAPRTGGAATDDSVRLRLTDPAGAPQPGLIRLPDDAIVDVFRARAALREAFRQLATGTYPGRPAAGALSRGLHTFSSRVPHAVTAPGVWLSEYLTGPVAGDQGAFAGEVLNQHLSVANLLARAQQIFSGVYVIEGLVLPGLGADQEMSLEITGYLHNASYSGSFGSHGQRDLNATDTSSRQRSVATSHQFGGGVLALQALPTAPAGSPPPRVAQANPSVRVAGSRRTEATVEHSASTSVVRIPTDAADQYLITADATVLVTLRQGTRNFFGNLVGYGSRGGVTVAIDLPRAVEFTMAPSHLARYARWFADVSGLPRPAPADPTLPPPDHFVRTGEIGTGSVLSLTQVDDPVRRNEVRDRLHQELVAQVERAAPGVTRPGHSAYLPGVATRLADLTAPPALRVLPARGTVRMWFRYAATGGARLIEVTLEARPQAGPPARAALLGRPAGEKTAVETTQIHAPENRSDTQGISRTLQVTAAPISRYPRPGGSSGRTDRTGPTLTASVTRGSATRNDFGADDRQWTRTGNAADFDDIVYDITGTVRSELIWDWPPDLLGGLLDQGWVSLTEPGGGPLAQRLARMIRGPRRPQLRVPALVDIRFVGSEAATPRPHDPPVWPRVTHSDPRRTASHTPAPDGGRPFVAGPALVPTGPTPVTGFNGFPQLAEALAAVAPDSAGAWGLSADATPEAAVSRLGELIQSGRISVGMTGTAAGLTTTMPGSWPGESDPAETPALQVTLHNPRSITHADDVAVDRLRKPVRSTSSSSVMSTAAGLGYQSTLSGNRPNLHVVGFTAPLLARQPNARTGGAAVSAGQRERIKTGNTSRSSTGADTRSHQILVDAVITVTGPEGTRYVTGTAGVRMFERELLGHGVIGPRVAPQVYDLPAMLAGQPSAPLRDWFTHPVTELPRALAGALDGADAGAQLWLDLGPDPDGSRLARALYVGSRTAVAANRPVEVVVRGGTGLRFWPFDADGRLADLTPATTPTWDVLRTAIVTADDAAQAEADAAARETELAPKEARTADELAAANSALKRAVDAHDAAVKELTEARLERQNLTERLGDAERAQAEADSAVGERDLTVTAAEERLTRAEQRLRDLREEAAMSRPSASGPAGTAAARTDPGPDAVSAAASERDTARSQRDVARGRADEARAAAERAARTLAELKDRLTTAEEQVSAALEEEQVRAQAVDEAEAIRNTRYEEHRLFVRELEGARQEQVDQRALSNDAWAQLPGLAAMLAADRCREMIGAARFPLGSLGKAPGGSGA
ncbi:hypothetical protein ACIHEJ_35185 [Streptomyces sp. NPDC052301]|uniref:hypothetical protein n=1 Tax=Streptomyces sp. NPDC052301 TaxID=3365687 RepID=UPI0037D2C1FA